MIPCGLISALVGDRLTRHSHNVSPIDDKSKQKFLLVQINFVGYKRQVRKKPIELPGRLLTATRLLLLNRPASITLAMIAHDTRLPYPWIKTLQADEHCRPAVHRVELLHDYLTKKRDEVARL